MAKQSLLLWRHADAEEGYPDSERALTAQGHTQARRMGAWLDRNIPMDIRIFSSPARRAQQTVEQCGREFTILDTLTTAPNTQKILENIPWPESPCLLGGHMPALGQIASFLLTQQISDWHIEKCAVWWLQGGVGSATLKAVLT